MADEFAVGDIIQLNNTEQQGEVLEVIRVHTGEPGPLLKVQLHDADAGSRKGKDKAAGKAALPESTYWTAHSVMLVQSAADAAPKKAAHSDKKPEHSDKKPEHHETHPTHNLGKAK